MSLPASERDLHAQIADLRNGFPRLQDHELFVAWFVHATLTDDLGKATASLTGNSRDKGADAIMIDDRSKTVSIVQGKYHKKINGGTEKRPDVVSFAQLARDLHGSDDDFRALRKETDPKVHTRISDARECLKKRGYQLQLYFVTTARVSAELSKEAEQICRRAQGPSRIEFFNGSKVLLRITDYLDGVAPAVASLDLPLEVGHGVTSDCLRRHDAKNDITAWVFSMNGSSVAEMFDAAGIRLFARNVRGFLGDKKHVNKGMQETIEKEPGNFWYYNNGITIICDKAERISVGGKDTMRISSPQVINGQQTTRTLNSSIHNDSAASVMVKAIEVRRNVKDGAERFDSLVSRIVAGTNWQNAILASDLMANDRRQVDLERELRKFNYCYLRKRQAKSEIRRHIGQHQRIVTKEEIAQSVAACELDPAIVREGKEGLFEEQLYPKVFPTSDPIFYLNRWRTLRGVSRTSKGFPERAYAKWVVVNFIWAKLSPLVRSKAMGSAFRECSEWHVAPVSTTMREAVQTVFRAALTFYRHSKGSGERAIDVSTFFKRKRLPQEFEAYLQGPGKNFKQTFDRRWQRFEKQLRDLDS